MGKALKGCLVVALLSVIIFSACAGPSLLPKSDARVSEEYGYDDAGRFSYKILPDGDKIRYSYDAEGQLAGVSAPGMQIKLAYDERGNTTLAQDNAGKQEYRYDQLNRPVEVVYKHGVEKSLRYEYDPKDRITSINILGKNNEPEYRVNYEYDLFGNLLSVDDVMGRTEYSYYPEKDTDNE